MIILINKPSIQKISIDRKESIYVKLNNEVLKNHSKILTCNELVKETHNTIVTGSDYNMNFLYWEVQ